MATRKIPNHRTGLPIGTVTRVLTEAGYRCAVPTCRTILALDLHHIWEVSAGGGNEPSNLIALCPNCHALYHRGTISPTAIHAYKAMLVALGQAFDAEALDRLRFLSMCEKDFLVVSGDGLLQFSRLIAADLVTVEQKVNNAWHMVTYTVNLTERGARILSAWSAGNPEEIAKALAGTEFSQSKPMTLPFKGVPL